MNDLPIDIRIAQERDQSRLHIGCGGLRCVATSTTFDEGPSFLQFWKLPKCPPDTLPNRPGIPFEGMPLGQA
jgi:hypothetical protein